MEGIKIISANCQGLGDKNKRKDVFSYLRSKNYNIFCLQDTHFTPEIANIIRAEWGFDCYFNSLNSNSRGVAIFFNNNFEYKVIREKREFDGNFLALDLEIENNRITLITIYGPNTDSPMFYDKIIDVLNLFDNESCIICGDFNLVLDPDKDYSNYRNINNPKARERVLEIIDIFNLVDIFREQYPDKKIHLA